MKRRIVAGNGMAGVACVAQTLKHALRFDINYNRILLSSVSRGWRA